MIECYNCGSYTHDNDWDGGEFLNHDGKPSSYCLDCVVDLGLGAPPQVRSIKPGRFMYESKRGRGHSVLIDRGRPRLRQRYEGVTVVGINLDSNRSEVIFAGEAHGVWGHSSDDAAADIAEHVARNSVNHTLEKIILTGPDNTMDGTAEWTVPLTDGGLATLLERQESVRLGTAPICSGCGCVSHSLEKNMCFDCAFSAHIADGGYDD